MMQTEHTEHVHCFICSACMDIPIKVLIDIELDNRQEGIDKATLICDVCL